MCIYILCIHDVKKISFIFFYYFRYMLQVYGITKPYVLQASKFSLLVMAVRSFRYLDIRRAQSGRLENSPRFLGEWLEEALISWGWYDGRLW